MIFVSKAGRYNLVLRQSLPGNPVMALPPTPGLHILFELGRVDIPDEEVETIALMKKNKFFNKDFFAVENLKEDPFSDLRLERSPEHSMLQVSGPDAGKSFGSPNTQAEKVRKQIQGAAKELLEAMLPTIIEKVRADVTAEFKAKESPAFSTTENRETVVVPSSVGVTTTGTPANTTTTEAPKTTKKK